MKQPLFIQNTSIDEKRIAFIERIVSRLARRSKKTAKAMVSPVPIMASVMGEDISGTILKSLIFEGEISKLAVRLGSKPKGDVWIGVKAGDVGSQRQMEKQAGVFDLSLSSSNGDLLEVSIWSTEADIIEEVLISILWHPAKDSVEVKTFLIDELEEQANVCIEEDS